MLKSDVGIKAIGDCGIDLEYGVTETSLVFGSGVARDGVTEKSRNQ